MPIPAAPALGLPASSAQVAKGIDGIKCQRNEKVAFHIHVHLTLFVNGKPRLVPAGSASGRPSSSRAPSTASS